MPVFILMKPSCKKFLQLGFFASNVIASFLISNTAIAQQGSCYLKMKEGGDFDINDYQVAKKNCVISSDQRDVQQLRTFSSQGLNYSLVVDRQSLQTYIVSASCLAACTPETATVDSRYKALVQKSTAAPFLTDNDGLTTDTNSTVNYLTIDLCPSSKVFERNFFQYLSQVYMDKKFPVALAVSGDWIIRHKEELKEILDLQANQKIDITWVNHTRHHPYTPGLPNQHNFLLRSDVDPVKEILEQESLMLSKGLQPSIFLRYPGLISDQKLVQTTEALGLIPLGSQAWIAKTRKFSLGDIILLHGNGNESNGISLFYDLVKNNKILNFTWRSLTAWGQNG